MATKLITPESEAPFNPNDLSKREMSDMRKVFEVYDYMSRNNMKATPNDYSGGWLYGYNGDNVGVFTDYEDDVISDMAMGGSEFVRWLPASSTDTWYTTISHLSFVTAEDYDGSTTYLQHLVNQADIGECDFGDGADYQVYEYQHTMERMSFSNKNRPITHTVGLRNFKKVERKILRGARAGYTIDNDSDWVLALLTERIEQHMNWVVWNGNPGASASSNKNMIEGLDLIIRENWVKDHMINAGYAYWSDPYIIDGTAITDPVVQLRAIMAMAAKIIDRMADRGYNPSTGDVALVMSKSHWKVYSEVMAAGALTKLFSNQTQLNVTPESVQNELSRIRNNKEIEVMGFSVPVIIENGLGVNVQTQAGHSAVFGDVYFLTRSYRGMNILNYEYLDWNSSDLSVNPDPNVGPNLLFDDAQLGGMVRSTYGFTDSVQQCWFYGFEMYGRIVPKMASLNGRVRNLIVPTELADDLESSQFWHQNFYVHEGVAGHQGNAMYTVKG